MTGRDGHRYDATIVGASLARCAAAIQLGRAGARVALVEQRPDPAAFKQPCTHMIRASGVPTLERIGLLEPIVAAGGVRSRARVHTPWGWIVAPPERAGLGVNLRRELLDPLIREIAANTPGVDLMLGLTARRLVREGGTWSGVVVGDRDGVETTLRARLLVGADGRDSHVGEFAGLPGKTLPHGRFAYGAYFEGPLPDHFPDSSLWFLDPDVAAAFPTDEGLIFYVAMPTKRRLAEFRRDPEAALSSHIAALPDAPPIHEAQRVSPVIGKLDMPNRVRGPIAPGLALIGDAALATDPLFGVGCGWALQSAEWLAEAVGPGIQGEEQLEHGLKRYARRRRELRLHALQIHDYATGRRFRGPERMLMAAAVRDAAVAAGIDAFATRRISPQKAAVTLVPRAIVGNARAALSQTLGASTRRSPV